MKKVLVIHGGNTYRSYDAFVEYTKTRDVQPERMKPKIDWKYYLDKKLGDGFDVYNPSMPGKDMAEYYLWELWYKKVIDVVGSPDIVIGHSLGAMFLVKYYSENLSKKQLDALYLVAPVYCGDENKEHHCHSFSLEEDIHILQKNAKYIHFFFSKDDMVVLYENSAFFEEKLPEVKYSHFTDRGHFNQERFPELVNEIKRITQQ